MVLESSSATNSLKIQCSVSIERLTSLGMESAFDSEGQLYVRDDEVSVGYISSS